MDGPKLTSVRRRALYNDILEFLIQKLNNSNLILLSLKIVYGPKYHILKLNADLMATQPT